MNKIILNKKQGIVIKVFDENYQAEINIDSSNIFFKINDIKNSQKSIFKISNSEIIFDADDIKIDSDEFISNIIDIFSIETKGSYVKFTDDINIKSSNINFNITSNTEISANKILFN